MSGPCQNDTINDIAWNVATSIPGAGSIIAGSKALLYDLPTALGLDADDSQEKQKQGARDLFSDTVSAIPLIGTVTSLAGIAYDVTTDDTWGNLTNQMLGGEDAYPVVPNADDFPGGVVPTMSEDPRTGVPTAPPICDWPEIEQ